MYHERQIRLLIFGPFSKLRTNCMSNYNSLKLQANWPWCPDIFSANQPIDPITDRCAQFWACKEISKPYVVRANDRNIGDVPHIYSLIYETLKPLSPVISSPLVTDWLTPDKGKVQSPCQFGHAVDNRPNHPKAEQAPPSNTPVYLPDFPCLRWLNIQHKTDPLRNHFKIDSSYDYYDAVLR